MWQTEDVNGTQTRILEVWFLIEVNRLFLGGEGPNLNKTQNQKMES